MLTIVILVFNQLGVTRECVARIRKNSDNHVPIFIVDNCSDLSTQSELKKLGDKYIRNHENVGVIEAMNEAWPLVETDFVMYMHNDLMILEPNWDTKVINVLNQIPNLGVAGFGGGDGVSLNGLRHHFMSNMIDAERHGQRLQTDYAPAVVEDGMCLIINRELIPSIGGIAKEYKIHHFYDLDVCMEAIYHGYKVATISCSIRHLGGQTSVRPEYGNWLKAKDLLDINLHHQNMQVFNRKWGDKFPVSVDEHFVYTDRHGVITL